MSRYQRIQEFEESTDSRFLGVIPIAGIVQSEHETIVIGAIERYSDRAFLSAHLMMGPKHPEHEWRRKGRGGHPDILLRCSDDLATEYFVMPRGSGGDDTTYRFEQAIMPGIPEHATTLTLELAGITWDGPHFYTDEPPESDPPRFRWRIKIDLSGQVAVTAMEAIP